VNTGKTILQVWWLAGVLLLTACSTTHQMVREDTQVQRPDSEVVESQLLDVWITLFESGKLPEDEDDAKGLSVEIREAEARYMPLLLRDTLERTGYWGAVRVVPGGTEGGEIRVHGTILVSDGEHLELMITAQDATGIEWFRHSYEAEATLEDYQQTAATGRDVFQALYNTIANDLARHRLTLSQAEVTNIRRVAGLRFAADLAPDAFDGFLEENDGAFLIQRLPAEGDPMVGRINAIRERDFLLVDTLNGHFDNFYAEMQDPYFQWRKTRLEELEAMREIERQARNRKLLGAAAIIGAIAIEALGGDSTRASTGSLRNMMIVGGAYAIKTGFDKDSEATIHQDAIEELGESFAAETQPLVVEVEGETHELTGSAENQYQQWRVLLRRIYATETGLIDTTH
jgi:hypothetical protein